MGSKSAEAQAIEGAANGARRRPRFLCLHGFRTSGEIMRTQVIGKWPNCITSRLDLFFPDAPFAAEGNSDVEGIFNPPYYEWFQFINGFTGLRNFNECVAYIEELMINHGPFDGLMGFSQGAMLSAALPGLQAKGMALLRVPLVKYLMIISGAKLPVPLMEAAYDTKIMCPSLHFIGEFDFLKKLSYALLDAFLNPIIVHHPSGHTIPRLDDKSVEAVQSFIENIEKDLNLIGPQSSL